MIIQIVALGEYITQSKDEPIIGRSYQLEDAASGTSAQTRAFHALLGVYYVSRAWSYPGSGYNDGATYDEFRNMIKRKLGAGFESFIYVEGNPPVIRDAKLISDIPSNIPRSLIRGRLKSWADYTKRERRDTMDKLIVEMHEVGVNTSKFFEILEGMDRLWDK